MKNAEKALEIQLMAISLSFKMNAILCPLCFDPRLGSALSALDAREFAVLTFLFKSNFYGSWEFLVV